MCGPNVHDIPSIHIYNLQTNRVFLPGMTRRGHGHILAICSVLGWEAASRGISYSATKFGVRGMMDALTEELRHTESAVQTTTIFPTLIYTRKEFIDIVTKTMTYVHT